MKGQTMYDFENESPEALDAWDNYLDKKFVPYEYIEKFAYFSAWKHATAAIESRKK